MNRPLNKYLTDEYVAKQRSASVDEVPDGGCDVEVSVEEKVFGDKNLSRHAKCFAYEEDTVLSNDELDISDSDEDSCEDSDLVEDEADKEDGSDRPVVQKFNPNAAAAFKSYKSAVKIDPDTLIVENLDLVQRIVNKVATWLKPPLSKDDLVSAGTIGLVKAARDYDCSSEADFKTYAYIRVKGAIIDQLRKWTFTPTEVNKQLKEMRSHYNLIVETTGNPPTDEELSDSLGVPMDKLYKMYETNRSNQFYSIDKSEPDGYSIGESYEGKSVQPWEKMEHTETLGELSSAIMKLPEKQRQVVILYYNQQLTMREISEVIGITESRVSQLHASAVFKLKGYMGVE